MVFAPLVSALATALLSSVTYADNISVAQHQHPIPRISLQHLQSAISSSTNNNNDQLNLHRLLHESHGILRIAVDGSGIEDDVGHDTNSFSNLRKLALSHLCDCPTFNSSSSSSTRGTSSSPTLFEEALQSHPKDLQQITLPDGTVRRTLASATIGFDIDSTKEDGDAPDNNIESSHQHQHATALELPSWVQDSCGHDAYDSFEELRDVVANVVDTFVNKLDQENKLSNVGKNRNNVNGGGNTNTNNEQSYREILSNANHLEHFHVYTKGSEHNEGGIGGDDEKEEDESYGNGEIHTNSAKEGASKTTLDYHTDAGFFLSFVPAMDCRSYTTDSTSFFLEGQDEPLTFEEDEVIIMLGAGAQYWLPSSSHGQRSNHGSHEGHPPGKQQYPFLAASHALRLLPDIRRTWYGKMHLLPTSLTSDNTALSSFQLKDYDAHVPNSPVDGCGTNTDFDNENLVSSSSSSLSLSTNSVQRQSRRRLQHVNSPSNCNNVTNFFCWYQCINIPSSDDAEAYVYDGYSLYCLDPALLTSDDPIPDATAPCKGGYVHNSNCQGSWQKTDENVPGYKLPYEVKQKEQVSKSTSTYPMPDMGDKYCYGGTSMYMDGFTWQGTACVIYLFSSWVLNTPGKFAVASFGSIFIGIALESVLWKRRSVYALPAGARRLILSTMMYGLQLSMGYFIMLVIMTYSGPLFICTVGGMMIGHVIFNAQDSFVKKREERRKSRQNSLVGGDGVAGMGATSYGSTKHSTYQHSASMPVSGSSHSTTEVELENGNGLVKKTSHLRDSSSESTKLRGAVADGATPCCQYTL